MSKFTLDRDPCTAKRSDKGFTSSIRRTFNWSANVEDMKSPKDPESSNARAGCPLTMTTTTTGLGTIRVASLGTAALRCKPSPGSCTMCSSHWSTAATFLAAGTACLGPSKSPEDPSAELVQVWLSSSEESLESEMDCKSGYHRQKTRPNPRPIPAQASSPRPQHRSPTAAEDQASYPHRACHGLLTGAATSRSSSTSLHPRLRHPDLLHPLLAYHHPPRASCHHHPP
ncbi:hypothetical protein FPV67DRAFT_557453 [Lyophyllum atratum]|nr:hypothetical protein FPV67DRAFT_557453 [Lyophyllum atratum]